MKIAIISESPSITTGFGLVCKQIVLALAPHHEIVCFGVNAFGETFDRSLYPCKIWAVGNNNLVPALSDFLRFENPDMLFISIDVIAVQTWTNMARAVGWKGPIIAHFVLDGLPNDYEFLQFLTTVQGRTTPTRVAADYLFQLGIDDIVVAPHAVDLDIFKPLHYREKLREEANLNNKFVIGVFGRNNERKQQPRVLMALSELVKEELADDIMLYLHCQPQDDAGLGGWNLKSIAKRLEIEQIVMFPEPNFNQLKGTPLTNNKTNLNTDDNSSYPHMPACYNYVERINCCDLIINVSYCGGFELGLIEAQACGVPVAVTNDYGILAEVVGNSAYLLEAIDIGIWRTGAKQHFIAPKTIVQAIKDVKTDENLRNKLKILGLQNASQYLWKNFHKSIVGLVDSVWRNTRSKS